MAQNKCTLTHKESDNATPVRFSAEDIAALKPKAAAKGLDFVAQPGVHCVHPELMPLVREVFGDRPLL